MLPPWLFGINSPLRAPTEPRIQIADLLKPAGLLEPNDIALLEKTSLTTDKDDFTLEETKRIRWLDQYLDIPRVNLLLDYTYEAVCRCMTVGDLIPVELRSRKHTSDAIKLGHLDVLQWMHASGYTLCNNPVILAAKHGHLHILEWLDSIKHEWSADEIIHASEQAMVNDHLHVVRWIFDTRKYVPSESVDDLVRDGKIASLEFLLGLDPHILDGYPIEIAIRHDRQLVLEWLLAHGIPWGDHCYEAAFGTHNMDLCEWLHAQGCPWDAGAGPEHDHNLYELMIIENNLYNIQWLHARGCPWDDETMETAAQHGNTGIIRWMYEHGCPWTESTMTVFIQRKPYDLPFVRWLHLNGCPCDERTMAASAQHENREILQWLAANDCPRDSSACRIAAKNNRLSALKWMHANNFPWDARTFSEAAKRGDMPMLQWLHAQGCPWDARTCLRAAQYGQLHALQWLRARGCPWDAADICSQSTLYATCLNVLPWLKEQGCTVDDRVMTGAIRHGHVSVIQWLYANNWPVSQTQYQTAIDVDDSLELMKCLHSNGEPLTPAVALHAAQRDRPRIFRWLIDNSCPFDVATCLAAAEAVDSDDILNIIHELTQES